MRANRVWLRADVGMSWRSFIEKAERRDHAVQIYDGVDELASSVGAYLANGFAAGAPGILIATPGHRRAFEEELRARGLEPLDLRKRGLLTCRDAEETLAELMDADGRPSAARFEATVGALVDGLAQRFPKRTIRAFGEMVDILSSHGDSEAAIELEGLWNDLARTRRLALLCGYRLDIFDIEVQRGALPAVLDVHTHAQPAQDPSRLADAVDAALREIVGPIDAARIYLDVAEQHGLRRLPRGQAVLGWLSTADAGIAQSVLASARRHYAAH